MLPTAIIDKKRDGFELSRDEIAFMINGLTADTIPNYQIAAWAMAITCRGMTSAETAHLTDVMLDSGSRLQRVGDRPRVDKHSTGGLGDKISLTLAPLLACFDIEVPMLSGRGLGITGGTLDKLEAYPGYRCDLSSDEINQQLKRIGCVITGTTPDIAPADRKLYALRDVTGTVPSVPLITASIMSKKLAATLDALVLDVKWGSAAFMQTLDKARELAASLIATGQRMGVATRAILTDMNQPLGRMVGNACEANESVEVLQGMGPNDVRELTLALAAPLLVQAGVCNDEQSSREQMIDKLESGHALERFQQMIAAQSGTYSDRLKLAPASEVISTSEGWIGSMNGAELGRVVIELGGGRRQAGQQLDHSVGIEMLVRIGDAVQVGQPIARIFGSRIFGTRGEQVDAAADKLRRAIAIMDHPVQPPQLIVN